jgi:hypothetical protein
MPNRIVTVAVVAILLAIAAIPVDAHHSHSTIDNNKPIEFKGTLTEFRWRSPHVYLKIDSIQADGSVVNYTIETLNPTALSKVGWGKEIFAPGDKVTWAGHHDKDPDRAYASLDWVEKIGDQRRFTTERELAPYLDEHNITLEQYLGLEPTQPATRVGEGIWSRIGKSGGRFPPIRSPRKDWPYTELAAAEVAAFSEDDNPLNNCEWPGFPKSMFGPINTKFEWLDDKTIMVDLDLAPEGRLIHLDPDTPAGEPSKQGHSIGHFEGDELIVETTNFLPSKWGIYTGVNSSEQKRVVERYWLSDGGMRLNVEMQVTDPVYLTETLTITHQWGKIANRPIVKAECSLDNANYYLTAGYEE